MGGSGGILGPSDSGKLRGRLREAERKATTAEFETRIADLMASTLADYNSRDVEGTRAILNRIKKELGDELQDSVDLLFGGSVAKHTYVDGLSDVDALVVLSRDVAADESPASVRSLFAERLRALYGRDRVQEGTLAVTVTLDNKSIQLLPAVREGDGFRIASSDGTRWSSIRPDKFATRLTNANAEMNGKLVPTVKLAKGIIALFPEQRRLSGYHVEALAVEIFRNYSGDKTPKAMLTRFFEQAPRLVHAPITDSTGQSTQVDEYLGPTNSVQRGIVADALDRVARRIRNADGAQSLDRWRDLLEGA